MQNTFSQSGNDSKCFFKKIIFQNRYVALETGLDPPPFMANTILNFHFDYWHPSLTYTADMPAMSNMSPPQEYSFVQLTFQRFCRHNPIAEGQWQGKQRGSSWLLRWLQSVFGEPTPGTTFNNMITSTWNNVQPKGQNMINARHTGPSMRRNYRRSEI